MMGGHGLEGSNPLQTLYGGWIGTSEGIKGRNMLQGQSSTDARKVHSLPFWRQIRWNLTFAFVLLVVLALTIVQAITLPLIRANAQQQVLNQLESVAVLKHNQINRWLYEGQYALT